MATKNLSQLSADLMQVYDQLKSGKMNADKAKDLAKVANAAVNTARVVLDHSIWLNPKGAPKSQKKPVKILQ